MNSIVSQDLEYLRRVLASPRAYRNFDDLILKLAKRLVAAKSAGKRVDIGNDPRLRRIFALVEALP